LDWMEAGGGSGTLQNRLRQGSTKKKVTTRVWKTPDRTNVGRGSEGRVGEAEEIEEKETLKKEG